MKSRQFCKRNTCKWEFKEEKQRKSENERENLVNEKVREVKWEQSGGEWERREDSGRRDDRSSVHADRSGRLYGYEREEGNSTESDTNKENKWGKREKIKGNNGIDGTEWRR